MPNCRRPPAMISAAPASSTMYHGFSYRMSMTAVPISIVRVRAPIAASSGNGELSWRAKWCTRKYAPSAPSSSAATASSIDCCRTSAAERASDRGGGRPVAEGEETDALHVRWNAPAGRGCSARNDRAGAGKGGRPQAHKTQASGSGCHDLGWAPDLLHLHHGAAWSGDDVFEQREDEHAADDQQDGPDVIGER